MKPVQKAVYSISNPYAYGPAGWNKILATASVRWREERTEAKLVRLAELWVLFLFLLGPVVIVSSKPMHCAAVVN